MTRLLSVIFALALAAPAFGFDQTHAGWDGVLKKYQTDKGMVRYKDLKADAADKAHPLNTYLAALQAVPKAEWEGWSKGDKMAFLINAYNALTVKLIVDHYPVASIKKIGGILTKPWSVEFFSLFGGALKALDPIEHEWLRPQFKDFRIHAAVNCASISCPPLRREAFVGARLDLQLDEQMQNWLADPSRNKYDAAKGELELSKLFDWYKKDFEDWGGGVKAVVTKYGPEAAKKAYAAKEPDVDYLDYDWGLNEAK